MKVGPADLSKLAMCVENKLIDAVEMDITKIEPAEDGVNQYRLVVVYREFQPEKFGLIEIKEHN